MTINLNRTLFQSAERSKPIRENEVAIENALNDQQAQIDAIITPASGSETVNARDYHTVLRDRLRSASKAQGNVIVTGGVVAEQTVPDMTVSVTAGEALVNGVACKWVLQNSGTITAPSVNPRFDVVVVNSDNTISIVAGLESTTPVLPDIFLTVNVSVFPAPLLWSTTPWKFWIRSLLPSIIL